MGSADNHIPDSLVEAARRQALEVASGALSNCNRASAVAVTRGFSAYGKVHPLG